MKLSIKPESAKFKYYSEVQRGLGGGSSKKNKNETIKELDREKLLFGKSFWVKQRTCCSL